MKRNFPNYSVGLDSTLDTIRKLDYERGLDDALNCYSPDDSATDLADKIRALKEPKEQHGSR